MRGDQSDLEVERLGVAGPAQLQDHQLGAGGEEGGEAAGRDLAVGVEGQHQLAEGQACRASAQTVQSSRRHCGPADEGLIYSDIFRLAHFTCTLIQVAGL